MARLSKFSGIGEDPYRIRSIELRSRRPRLGQSITIESMVGTQTTWVTRSASIAAIEVSGSKRGSSRAALAVASCMLTRPPPDMWKRGGVTNVTDRAVTPLV